MEQITKLLEEKTIDSESIYDLLYNLHFWMNLSESEEDIKNGRIITLDEFDREMEAKYESYLNKKSTRKP